MTESIQKILRDLAPFLLLVLLSMPLAAQDSYRIKITVEGLEDSVAMLGYHFGKSRYLTDTAAIDKNGVMIFEKESDLKTGVYFVYTASKYYLEFVVDEQNFELATTVQSAYPGMKITNSPTNEQFKKFQILMIDYQKKSKEVGEGLVSATNKEDSVAIYENLRAMSAQNEIDRENLRKEFGDTFVAQVLRLMNKSPQLKIESDSLTIEQRKIQYDYYKDHFFDGIDFNAEGFMRTPLMNAKVMEYIDDVTFQNPDSVISSVDEILSLTENNEDAYRYWIVTFFQKYQNSTIMGMDKVFVHIADNYYLAGKVSWADEEMIKKLSDEMVFHRENQIGLKAPQIYLQDTLNQNKALHSINSKYMVLYFYDPDCGHCKKKTPDLLNLYHEIGDDVEVLGVCVGTDEGKWKKFIKEFNLDWVNLADLKYQSNFRVQYNVRSTPTIYVLDSEKNIIAKKLGVDQIGDFIEDRRRIDSYKNQ